MFKANRLRKSFSQLQRAAFDALESRQHFSAATTLVVGNSLYTAVNGTGDDNASDLYVSNLDGSNQTQLAHWTANNAITHLFAYHDKLLFDANYLYNNNQGKEAWSSDGTAAGTARLFNVQFGVPPADFVPSEFHLVNDRAVFTAMSNQVFTTDGTSAGTHRLGTYNTFISYSSSAVSADQTSRYGGLETWTSDGITPLTLLVSKSTTVTSSTDSQGATDIQIFPDGDGHIVAVNDHTGHTTYFDAAFANRIVLRGGSTVPSIFRIDPSITLPFDYYSVGAADQVTGGGGINTVHFARSSTLQQANIGVGPTDDGAWATWSTAQSVWLHGRFSSFVNADGSSVALDDAGVLHITGSAGDDVIEFGQGSYLNFQINH